MDKEIHVGKDDFELVDGKLVIKNAEILDAIQSEQGINLDGDDGQNSVSIGLIVTA